MANRKHLAILKKGVAAWNEWRKDNPKLTPELSVADLRGKDLTRADLSGANLFRANLSRADLGGAYLNTADLRDANLGRANLNNASLFNVDLSGASLTEATLNSADLGRATLKRATLAMAQLILTDLRYANLSNADLTGADLKLARFVGVNLSEVDLTNATIGGTEFRDVDLSHASGLETVKHAGPSPIDINTIYKSKGKIPHSFLRGCGVPDNFIEYMAALVGTGIEFYSLFISYSTKDQGFAERLHADLQDKGVRCWFAPHELRGGRKVYRQIDEAIRVYDKLLLILSEASMASEWVRTEIAIARKREVEQKREVLFPVGLCPFETIRKWQYFDSDIGKDSAREIREYFIPDFSNWSDPDVYRKAFDRLLKALHGKPSPSSS